MSSNSGEIEKHDPEKQVDLGISPEHHLEHAEKAEDVDGLERVLNVRNST